MSVLVGMIQSDRKCLVQERGQIAECGGWPWEGALEGTLVRTEEQRLSVGRVKVGVGSVHLLASVFLSG